MNEICEVRNSTRDIKAKKDVHSKQVKDNKRLRDELETKNTITKLLIDNFKQLADSIGKSNTTVPLLQTINFSENSNFILPKKSAQKSKPTNILSPNRCHLLEPTSENIELVSDSIQNTDALRLSGNENELNRNRNVLASQNTGNKRFSVVINKYPDSIPKEISIGEIKTFIKNGKTKMVSFPGATSKEILHYLDVP